VTSHRPQIITLAFLLALSGLIVVYEMAMVGANGSDGTISMAVRWLFKRYPIMFCVFLIWIGILVGHIGFPIEP